MDIPKDLLDGYRQFRAGRYQHEVGRYLSLAESQPPDTMILGCADSRVDPATIFAVCSGFASMPSTLNMVPRTSASTTRPISSSTLCMRLSFTDMVMPSGPWWWRIERQLPAVKQRRVRPERSPDGSYRVPHGASSFHANHRLMQPGEGDLS